MTSERHKEEGGSAWSCIMFSSSVLLRLAALERLNAELNRRKSVKAALADALKTGNVHNMGH